MFVGIMDHFSPNSMIWKWNINKSPNPGLPKAQSNTWTSAYKIYIDLLLMAKRFDFRVEFPNLPSGHDGSCLEVVLWDNNDLKKIMIYMKTNL